MSATPSGAAGAGDGPAGSEPQVVDAAVRAENRARFEIELEFVQALANPFYLQTLAQQNMLTQPAFINYLQYLQYWKEKDYARFIQYPHALHHLDLLQYETFRTEIAKDDWREFLNQKQFDHWRTWRAAKKPREADAVGETAAESVKA
ncbi:SOH1-domain-containing protein [Sistotremastrum suecicum HHB10207 ss-3]|uniref:Mediator of RNA polymerase II transcription subunit 31 n=1 Tax=Sistotremastrum suecicum HHB10207 ss-3 TaxID=1314776 RepID=A0A166CBT6_9AGAM|nr:SOH1-domain-containing protein [Sistotremastrum suecicum HHB10207 ss-3]